MLCIFLLFIGFLTPCFVDLTPQSGGTELIKHGYYTLGYAEQHEQAAWVFYKLTPEMIMGDVERKDNFRADKSISTKSATLSDYKGSGYDRGHLAPAADMTASYQAMTESFYLSNVSPQTPGFNRGVWKRAETLVRNWAIEEKVLYVITGAIFDDNRGAIGSNEVTVPGYYYKVIYDPTERKKMIAMILPHESSSANLESFVVSVDSVEIRTGIDFFPGLPDKLERYLERRSDVTKWSF